MAEALPRLDHIYLIERARDEDFHRPGMGNVRVRNIGHRYHGEAILADLSRTFSEIEQARADERADFADPQSLGSTIVLEGADATYPLKLEALDSLSNHRKTPKQAKWLLLSVRPVTGDQPELATVWVADKYRSKFLKLFEDYLVEPPSTKAASINWQTEEGNPKNGALVANIARIRSSLLRDLWTSAGEPKRRQRQWWELWLDARTSSFDDFRRVAETFELRSLVRSFVLGDRVVVWVESTWERLEMLPFTGVAVAEVRRPSFVDTVEDLTPGEQAEYVIELAARTEAASSASPSVTLLDTGVLQGHVLLRDSLYPEDLHTIVGTSGSDTIGHGTSMAGLALYGDLGAVLSATEPVRLIHRLESVRMMSRSVTPDHDPLDFGTATVEAVALPEIAAQRSRVFCLTLSAVPDTPGEPTLWSASVDALAVGTDIVRSESQLRLLSTPNSALSRLVVVAAGNVNTYQLDHRAESDTSVVQDPAQSWNALTVGAYTDLASIPQDPQYSGWSPLAPCGELSPHSRTSLLFDQRRWPIKPDICMEGGNVLSDGRTGFEDKHPLLSLQTTGSANDVALTSANATSAATAQASRLAALAMCRYPEYWPETIRALLTHSAEWTPPMRDEIHDESAKLKRLGLLRRYGWGVPTEDAVLNSSRQAVTLVAQDEFVPFEGSEHRMRRFRLHELPWPSDVLSDIGAGEVRMRVTLSYFVEPSASRRGWRRRYTYASHALRFELQGPLETQEELVARINRDAQTGEDGAPAATTASPRWLIGPNQRNVGSLHQDVWEGTGAELSRCNSVAVYPVGGWWKNNRRSDRSGLPIRYALLVSLRTDEQDVDLHTPIMNQLRIPVSIPSG